MNSFVWVCGHCEIPAIPYPGSGFGWHNLSLFGMLENVVHKTKISIPFMRDIYTFCLGTLKKRRIVGCPTSDANLDGSRC